MYIHNTRTFEAHLPMIQALALSCKGELLVGECVLDICIFV